MRSLKILRDTRYGILLAILFFMAVAFTIRMIPSWFIKDAGFLYTMDTDTWYTLRQVEVMVNHFPQYDWFDPMTAFPTGKNIDWGPLFPFITAGLCMLTGATMQSAIIYVSSWVSPLMAALMVPVTYFIGKTVWDSKTGIVAAGLISIVSFIYYSITSFGLVTHHIGETLFSSLFFLVYLYYLVTVDRQIPDMKNPRTLLVPVALASLAGVLSFLALLMSTTTMLALMVIALFTLVQSVVDHLSGRTSDRLVVLNLVSLSVSALLLVLLGFKQPGISVTSYTIGLVYANLAVIGETALLFGVSAIFRGKIKPYLICLGALAVAGVAFIQIYPPFASLSLQAQTLLLGSSTYTVGVFNTAPLSLALAWEYFNIAIILTAGGFLVLAYHVAKNRNAAKIFILVWSAFMLLITVQYQRFAYFSTVNIVLLSAICITEPFSWKKSDGAPISLWALASRLIPRRAPAGERGGSTDELKEVCLGVIVILTVVLVAVSVYHDVDLGLNNPDREILPAWIESLNWLGKNTPSPGVDYFQQYDADTFSYPSGAYGILAMWDAGHWITFFARRIPITNPFQDHLSGSSGAYAFFLSQNESEADDILQAFGGRYVITNSNLAIDHFASLVLWENNSLDISPYITQFMAPGIHDPSSLSTRYGYDEAYFRTMIARLHIFDGSMQVPGTVDYIQYTIRREPDVNGFARVITDEQPLDVSRPHNNTPLIREGIDVSPQGAYANIFSDLPNRTLVSFPALQHYRLVHESPDITSVRMSPGSDSIMLPDIRYVKIFEYVKGAHILGNGTIEVPIEANTGRMFVYRQESKNGEFVVPYSQSGNPYDVRAIRPYHIAGTARYINVTETDVMEGTTVG